MRRTCSVCGFIFPDMYHFHLKCGDELCWECYVWAFRVIGKKTFGWARI